MICYNQTHTAGPPSVRSRARSVRALRLVAVVFLACASAPARAEVKVLHTDTFGLDLEVTTPLRFDTVATARGPRIRLRVEDWPVTSVPGEPALPYLVVPLVMPPTGGAQVMVVSRADTSAHVGPIIRAHEDQVIGIDDVADAPVPRANLPTATASVEELGVARDVRMGRLVVRAVRYADGTVRWAKKLRLAVRFTSVPASRPARARSESYANHPARLAANSEEIAAFHIPRTRVSPAARTTSLSVGPRLLLYINGDPAFEGIYRITGQDLAEWATNYGFDLSAIDPRTFRLEYRGQEVPIYVEGQDRGITDETFAIEFYARPNLQRFQSIAPDLYRDPFVDMGIYVLSWGGKYGARMAEEDGSVTTSPQAPNVVRAVTYRYTKHFETDNLYDRLGGTSNFLPVSANLIDRYFWKMVSSSRTSDFNLNIDSPADPDNYDIDPPVFEMMARGRNFQRHIVDIFLNGHSLGSVGRDSVARDLELIRFKTTYFPNLVAADGNVRISIQTGNLDPASGDAIYVNWFEITYNRLYKATNNYLPFRRPTKPTAGIFDFTLTGFTSPDISVYKVGVSRLTNLAIKHLPKSITGAEQGYQVRFQDRLDGDDPQYIAVTNERKLKPARVELLRPWARSLKDPSRGADYLIISHPALIDTVKLLADYRRSDAGGGFSVDVVDVRQVYDEFSSDYPTAQAIRDFIRYAARNWSVPPQYVLIAGDGITKFTDKWMKSPLALVPTGLEAVLKWGATGSDHGYSLAYGDDTLPDVYVGRIPAPDATTLRGVIDKIITFEQSPALATPWRNSIFMVAEGLPEFVSQQEWLSAEFPTHYVQHKLYNAPVPQDYLKLFSGGQSESLQELNRGSYWTIYLGHGGGGVWGSDRLLTFQHPQILTNTGRTGIFLSMTCFTGAFDDPDPDAKSLSELMLFASGGAAAWWGSTGVGWVNNDYYVTQSVVRAGMLSQSSEQRLGAILATGMIDYLMRFGGPNPPRGSFPHSVAYMYNLMGDPALRVAPPPPTINLQLSTHTPVLGDTVHVAGTVPDGTASGKAWLGLYDSRESQVYPPQGEGLLEVPVTNGAFNADMSVPSSLWGTDLKLKAYASSTAPVEEDWAGAARLTTAEILIDSVIVGRRSRDSIFVGATIHSAELVKAVACSVVVSSDGHADTVVPMVPINGSNRYRTAGPLDVSALPRNDPEAFIRPIIIVTDQRGRVSRRDDILPIYPNAVGRLRLNSLEMSGTSRPELVGAITNEGQVASDSVIVATWLLSNGAPVALLDEQKLGRLAPLDTQDSPASDNAIVPKIARSGGAAETDNSSFLPQRTRLKVALSDTLVNGRKPGAALLVTARSADGSSLPDSVVFAIPSNVVAFDPKSALSDTVQASAGQFRLDVPRGTFSGSTLVKIAVKTAPTQQGQPDLNVPGAKLGHPTAACDVRWLAPVDLSAGRSINLTLAIDPNDANLHRALSLNQLRVGYWNVDRNQWEIIAASLHTWAADNASVTVRITRQGLYGFVQVDDVIGPTIEISTSGQQFGEGAYVNAVTKFLVLVEDRNGVSTTSGDLRAWLDGVPLPDSAISLPTQTTSLTALPFTLTPPLLTPREKPYALRVEAHDAVGNATTKEVSFQVAEQAALEFYGNFPNPFGEDGTTFAFRFTRQMREVVFRIYDVSGRLVLKFSNYDLSQLYPDDPPEQHRSTSPARLEDALGRRLYAINYHELHWSGRDSRGEPLANGVYFGIITARDDDTGRLVAKHTFTMVKAE